MIVLLCRFLGAAGVLYMLTSACAGEMCLHWNFSLIVSVPHFSLAIYPSWIFSSSFLVYYHFTFGVHITVIYYYYYWRELVLFALAFVLYRLWKWMNFSIWFLNYVVWIAYDVAGILKSWVKGMTVEMMTLAWRTFVSRFSSILLPLCIVICRLSYRKQNEYYTKDPLLIGRIA